MKNVMFGLFAFVVTMGLNAQVKTPQASPFCKMEQTVGLTNVVLEYSRPSKRGRIIFGDLVPYGKIWRTGANSNTKITFSDDVTIDGKLLKAGSYAIYTIPNKERWEVMFYAGTDNWGVPQEWDKAKVALKTTAKTYPVDANIETFTILFDDLTNDSAVLGLLWENRYVGVKFNVPTDAQVSADIERAMAGTSANEYYAAAVYYYESGKDINQAKSWIDTSIEMTEKPAYWQYRQQSLIHAKAGDKKGAIEAAKKSLEGAKAAGNEDYIKMNTESLKAWGA